MTQEQAIQERRNQALNEVWAIIDNQTPHTINEWDYDTTVEQDRLNQIRIVFENLQQDILVLKSSPKWKKKFIIKQQN